MTRKDSQVRRLAVSSSAFMLALSLGWFGVGLALPDGTSQELDSTGTSLANEPVPEYQPALEGQPVAVLPPPGRAVPVRKAEEDSAPAEIGAAEMHPWRRELLDKHAPDLSRLLKAPLSLRALHHSPKTHFSFRDERPLLTADSFAAIQDAMRRRKSLKPPEGRYLAMGFRIDRSHPFEVVVGRTPRLLIGNAHGLLRGTTRRLGLGVKEGHIAWGRGVQRTESYLNDRARITARALRITESMFASNRWKPFENTDAFVVVLGKRGVRLLRFEGLEQLEDSVRAYFQLYEEFEDRIQEWLR